MRGREGAQGSRPAGHSPFASPGAALGSGWENTPSASSWVLSWLSLTSSSSRSSDSRPSRTAKCGERRSGEVAARQPGLRR